MWLPPTGTPPSPAARRIPLKDALPKLDSILIDQDRRLAVINGTRVGVGDSVGPRTVLRVEQDAVVLREPSGLAVRVELRPKARGGS
jgi:hypothetical protein